MLTLAQVREELPDLVNNYESVFTENEVRDLLSWYRVLDRIEKLPIERWVPSYKGAEQTEYEQEMGLKLKESEEAKYRNSINNVQLDGLHRRVDMLKQHFPNVEDSEIYAVLSEAFSIDYKENIERGDRERKIERELVAERNIEARRMR